MDIARVPVPVETRAPSGTTNAYVLGRDPAVLVDPAGRTDALDRLVRERDVSHVAVTHGHPDHVGAVRAYAGETDATVWAREGREERLRKAAGVAPDRSFSGGRDIPAGTGAVRVLETPGHAPDHVSFVAGDGGPVCCGDCAVREGSVVVGAPEGDLRAYLTTLRRLRAIDPLRALPGHGPPIDAPRETFERLIRHRLKREERIRSAIDGGARTIDEVLDVAYDKDLAGVRDLARATVVAHLEKLAVQGAIAWTGERAIPR